jgi:uncharacterized protein (TIGR03435 family)
MRRWWIAGALALTAVVALEAQTPQPRFEVASIKKRDSPVQGFPQRVAEHGTYSLPSATVASLVQFAYEVRDDFIVDGPNWIRSETFDVNAKAGRDASADDMRPMMQSLLADRFGLVIRREQRVMPHFELLMARTDRSVGPTLQKIDDCRNLAARPKAPSIPSGASAISGCGTMASIATMASRYMGAPVIDKTGIAGTFTHFMFMSPKDSIVSVPGLPQLGRPVIGPEADALPSFRDAMRDQLGLRMESVRGSSRCS